MILRVPITGTLKSYDPETKIGIGSDDDVIRPLDFNKLLPEGCDFRWDAVSYDYEKDIATVEVTFTKKITVTKRDNSKDPPEPLAWERESDTEFYKRQADIEKLLWDTFVCQSPEELRKITGEPKVIMPRGK